jgi:chromosome partitioning protein
MPKIEQRVEMQRYNTVELTVSQEEIVTPCFDSIYNVIYGEDGHGKAKE